MELFRGFCMALADSVPGVSGGSIAFILGFYDKFINSLNDIVYGNFEKKKEAVKYLIKLGCGWVIGFILAVIILTSLFETHIYKVSSLFLGFILASIPLIILEEKKVIKGNYKFLIFTLIGILLVVAISYFNPVTGGESSVNLTELDWKLVIYILGAAMVAISAMVLPGISGSTLLLIFGLYIPIMNAIKEFLHFNFAYFPALVIFGLGIISGIIITIKLIKIALERFRPQTIYAVIGLMLGSLYAIIVGPTTLDIPREPLSFDTFNILFFGIGILVVWGLQKIKESFEKKIN